MRPFHRLCLVCIALMLGVTAVAWLARPMRRAAMHPQSLGYRIDVNRADADTLALLSGIGPRLAGNIIERRESQGPFRSLDDLDAVKGIGPATIQHIAPYVKFVP